MHMSFISFQTDRNDIVLNFKRDLFEIKHERFKNVLSGGRSRSKSFDNVFFLFLPSHKVGHLNGVLLVG